MRQEYRSALSILHRLLLPVVVVLDPLILIGQKGDPLSKRHPDRSRNRMTLTKNEIEDENDDENEHDWVKAFDRSSFSRS
jgi:hypothetical protein